MVNIYDPTIFETEFEGRKFVCPVTGKGSWSTQVNSSSVSSLDHGEIKYKTMKYLSDNELNKESVIIEAFSGIGFSGYLYSRNAKMVHCIEQDNDVFGSLEKNIGYYPNVKLYHDNNVNVLENLVLDGVKANLIDLDPFQNFWEQLPFVPYLMDSGILILTDGSIDHIQRFGSKTFKRYGDLMKYKGRNSYKWVTEIFIPYVKSQINVEVQYFYVFRRIVRLITTYNGYQLKPETKKFFGSLPNYFGEYAYLEQGRGTQKMF